MSEIDRWLLEKNYQDLTPEERAMADQLLGSEEAYQAAARAAKMLSHRTSMISWPATLRDEVLQRFASKRRRPAVTLALWPALAAAAALALFLFLDLFKSRSLQIAQELQPSHHYPATRSAQNTLNYFFNNSHGVTKIMEPGAAEAPSLSSMPYVMEEKEDPFMSGNLNAEPPAAWTDEASAPLVAKESEAYMPVEASKATVAPGRIAPDDKESIHPPIADSLLFSRKESLAEVIISTGPRKKLQRKSRNKTDAEAGHPLWPGCENRPDKDSCTNQSVAQYIQRALKSANCQLSRPTRATLTLQPNGKIRHVIFHPSPPDCPPARLDSICHALPALIMPSPRKAELKINLIP